MDKIIVAAAGPLFSILLALVAACVVWLVGKQKDFIPTTTIGYVEAGMPGDKAGLQAGDEILSINGQSVNGFAGSLDSISEQIVLSSGDKIEFMVNRPGIEKPLKLISGFDTPPTKWFQRSSLRQVGIESAQPALVGKVYENSPGSKAGLDKGDTILSANGTELFSGLQLNQYLKKSNYQSVTIDVKKVSGEIVKMELTPEKPSKPKDSKPMIGILWDMSGGVDVRIVHPTPFEQVYNSIRMMYVTITKVADPKSSIGVDQLNGPIGIGKMIYQLLLTDEGWRRIIGFMVLLNVNLAIFNMLPFPVLDGGHITLAVLEKIAGRPVKTKALEIIQTACLFVIFSLFLYVTSKDILDPFGRGKGGALAEPVFSK